MKKKRRKQPKTADGKIPKLGMTVWYPWSHDSWRGPHSAELIGMDFDYGKLKFSDSEEGGISWDSICATKRGAEKIRDDFHKLTIERAKSH